MNRYARADFARTLALLAALALAGCARTELSTRLESDMERLQATISEARRLGAEQCAFDELAQAEGELQLARMEFGRTWLWAAEDHVKKAEKFASDAKDKSQECLVDRDGDGVRDLADKCPDQAETFNQYKDEDGCPDFIPRRAALLEDKIEILEPVPFIGAEATLAADALPVLDDVAMLLQQSPAMKVRIESHVADSGDAAADAALTDARAKNVRSYLVRRGVDPERLEVAGKGATTPIASNAAERGREVNTRIEFMIVGK